jgi:Rab proteins geranylgeranyltransferase component A
MSRSSRGTAVGDRQTRLQNNRGTYLVVVFILLSLKELIDRIEMMDESGGDGNQQDTSKISRTTAAVGTATTTESEVNSNVLVDDEGLYQHYDIVICGTGLIQSILASALSRYTSSVTTKILHIDGSDHYGNLDAVWTLPYLLSQHQQQLQQQQQEESLETTTRNVTTNRNFGKQQQEEQHRDPISNEGIEQILLHPMGELTSLQFHSVQRNTKHCSIRMNKHIQTPYGVGRIRSLERRNTISKSFESEASGGFVEPAAGALFLDRYATLEIELTSWTLTNGTFPKVYIGVAYVAIAEDSHGWSIDDQYMWDKHRIRTVSADRAVQILEQYSRSIAVDVTPYLLYASGPAVDGLLTSTVSNYIEFKSLDAILYYTPASKQTPSPTNASGTFNRVPCSKNDVFASQLLSPMDKRRLMKFLHLALDYAAAATAPNTSMTTEQHKDDLSTELAPPVMNTMSNAGMDNVTYVADELQSWNERHLNQGRSLIRPQNKAVASTDLQHLQFLCRQSSGESTKSFVSYLRDDQKLSPSLIALIRYALALDTSCNVEEDNNDEQNSQKGMIDTTTVATGMEQLCAHMLALGRFGSTAFLVPLYGSGELSQAFCRSAAVYGTTYLLRRAPTAIVLNSDESKNRWNVCGIHLSQKHNDSDDFTSSASSKQISCTHVVVPEGFIQRPKAHNSSKSQRVLRRISILSGKPIQIEEKGGPQQQRHVLILPPYSISAKQNSAIHGVVLDESVNVAPHVPGGCTILHLTTTIEHNDEACIDETLLADAFNVVLRSFSESDDENVVEIFHLCFSYEVHVPLDTDQAMYDILNIPNSDGLHIIQRPRPDLTADATFSQAATIFQQIYPNSTPDDFLKLSQATTDAIKAVLGENALNDDEEDEETMALASAVEMIDHGKE